MSAWRGFALLFCTAVPALGQHTVNLPVPQAEAPARSAPNQSIRLDVVVTDAKGAPIAGLAQSDFTLLDNMQAQPVLSFAAPGPSEPPADVILVVDAVNTGFQSVGYLRGELQKFFKTNEGALAQPVGLALFTDSGIAMAAEPTRDGNLLATTLDNKSTGLRTINRTMGFYGAEDRLALSLRAVASLAAYESHRPGRKLVVWISPGWPYLSGPGVQTSNAQQQGIFRTVIELRTALRNAQITLYSVDPAGTNDAGGFRTIYYREFLKPVTKPSQAQPGDLALQVLAQQSGGRVLNSSNDITSEVASCAREAGSLYTLTFNPGPPGSAAGYHALEIRLDKPGLVARTRTGYYTQP